jgi:uncharacterized protein YijF (DUF1287 family)
MIRHALIFLILTSLAGASEPKHIPAFIQAAKKQIGVTLIYNPAYKTISYPSGDVPLNEGVCSDVVIRAMRALKIDLQALIHKDMRKNWSTYPKKWGLRQPDRNIDHRRVPNLACYLESQGLKVKNNDYQPGDIIVWDLGKGLVHIGILSDQKTLFKQRYLVIHNIGQGVKEEDILNSYKIIGHYRINRHFIAHNSNRLT